MHTAESAVIVGALQPSGGTQDNFPFCHCVLGCTGIPEISLHGLPSPLPPTGSNALFPAEVNFATGDPTLVKLPDWFSPADPHPKQPDGTSDETK